MSTQRLCRDELSGSRCPRRHALKCSSDSQNPLRCVSPDRAKCRTHQLPPVGLPVVQLLCLRQRRVRLRRRPSQPAQYHPLDIDLGLGMAGITIEGAMHAADAGSPSTSRVCAHASMGVASFSGMAPSEVTSTGLHSPKSDSFMCPAASSSRLSGLMSLHIARTHAVSKQTCCAC